MKSLRTLSVLISGILTLGAAPALAATATGTLTVNAQVNNSCTIGNATLNFGTYVSASGTVGTTTVNVTCTPLVVYSLSLDQGANHDSVGATNRMKANSVGNYYIPYSVSFPASLPVGTGLPIATVITGTAPAGANVPSDTYSDSVVMTVTY
ncbi:spore coat protein U domain-containing protein [Deinococcus sp.]|uniref:spore coat protein U domain-containing protein n=1 Tax=Deinococcus sp. TaxID=47478 RepID=UPI003C7B8C04